MANAMVDLEYFFICSSGGMVTQRLLIGADSSLRFNKNADTTVVMPITINKGRPWDNISAVVIPAEPAEMAGAPCMIKS